MDEPSRPRGEAQAALARGLLDRLGPVLEVLVGEGVEVGSRGKVLQGLLPGHHDVGGLHPGEVLLVRGAHPPELHERLGEAPVLKPGVEAVQRLQKPPAHQGGKVPVEPAQNPHGPPARLGLGQHPVEPNGVVLGHELDLAGEALQDHLPHLLGLFNGPELGGKEDHPLGQAQARGQKEGQETRFPHAPPPFFGGEHTPLSRPPSRLLKPPPRESEEAGPGSLPGPPLAVFN